MAGSHEVRGSNPLFSNAETIDFSMVFYFAFMFETLPTLGHNRVIK